MKDINLQFEKEMSASLAPNALGLTILPTEQCCFRCDYCYEDFEIGKMPHSIEAGVSNLLKVRAPSLSSLNLAWFGGEPLMAKDVIYRLSETALKLSRLYSFDFRASMTTNAYLLDQKTYERLVNYRVKSFQITLDGIQHDHDLVRKRVDGEGTFNKIMENLQAIKASRHQANILLRLHYTPKNWSGVVALIRTLKETLLDDDRFSVIFRAVGKWGGQNDSDLDVFETTNDMATVEQILLNELYGHDGLPQEPDNLNICYASKANNMVIRANGSIAKCTVALSHPHNDVGRIKPNGTLDIHQEHFKRWLIGFQTGDLSQLACPAGSALKTNSSSLRSIPVITAAA